ncbi:hypothetical protein BBOV_III004140 [Babesia bovis T2Bo]|uniref:Uncharacterized protein n=1 Tax=Babesia bovis TaxID=5865 RepID=A7AN43_BABBO|nr:hypothetical protein BBOV_III004140 [Babesia bovis T2Bo]EDO07977.1 hypothetical protein BBOV_III004140 [Babesia bovis T2Bo]|eukprot:XP_001611545.1 hypothetical protein [Babesia bovis T2Bo]
MMLRVLFRRLGIVTLAWWIGGPSAIFVYAADNDAPNQATTSRETNIPLYTAEDLLTDETSRVEHLKAIKIMLQSINDTLGLTENSHDLQLIKRLGGLYVTLNKGCETSALSTLLKDAENLTITINGIIVAIDDIILLNCTKERQGAEQNKGGASNVCLGGVISKLINETLPNVMELMVSMRYNDYKTRLLKRINVARLYTHDTNILLSVLTNTYGKDIEVRSSYLLLPTLFNETNIYREHLSLILSWIDEQLTTLREISEALCPRDPLVNEFSLYDILLPNERIYRASLRSWYVYYEELMNYKEFVRRCLDFFEALDRALCVRQFPIKLRSFYSKGVALVEHIMRYHLWSSSKRNMVRRQIIRIRGTIRPFIDRYHQFVNISQQSSFDGLTDEDQLYSLQLADTNLRLLIAYFKNDITIMNKTMDYYTDDEVSRNDDLDGNLPALAWSRVKKHWALFQGLETAKYEYMTFFDKINQFRNVRFSTAEHSISEIEIMKAKELDELRKYLKSFGTIHQFVKVITMQIFEEQQRRNDPLAVLIKHDQAINLNIEMIHQISILVELIDETFRSYSIVEPSAFDVRMKFSSVSVPFRHIYASKCYKDLDKEHQYALTRRRDLKFIFKRVRMVSSQNEDLLNLYRRIVNVTDKYNSADWRDIVQDFFIMKDYADDVALIDLIIPCAQVLVNELEHISVLLEPQLSSLSARMKECARSVADEHRNDPVFASVWWMWFSRR